MRRKNHPYCGGCVMRIRGGSVGRGGERKMCYREVKKEVEASLDIKDVIDQTSKTIAMNITLLSIH